MSNYNPYSAPQHDQDAPRLLAGVASWDGKCLTIPKQFSFPRVCLKCASPQVNTRRTQKFAFTPIWARLLIVVCWPGALLAMALTTKRATLELPLCDAHHARWQTARKWNIALVVGLFVGIFGVSFARAASSDEAGLIVAGVILLLVVGLAIGVSKLVRPHLVQAKKIDDNFVTLTNIDATAGEQVARLSGAAAP